MPLVNNQNYGYIGEFYVGSGTPQKINILLDTGSANSWISGYDKDLSTGDTFREPEDHQDVKITFGSGYLKGYFVNDQLTIGNPDGPLSDKLVLDDYMFGMVTEQTCFHDTFEAIIGLAFPEFAEDGVTPLFDQMMDGSILKHNLFAFHMSMNPKHEDSEVMFGDWNRDKIEDSYNGEPEWHQVEHRLFWSIKLDDILIDGVSLGLCDGDTNCLFTPDTGTSLSTFPKLEMDAFEAAHPEWKKGSNTTCESEHTFGNLTYKINGIDYPIPSSHWMDRKPDGDTNTCNHKIWTLDVGQPGLEHLFIGGDVFMQIYYTIFDRETTDDFPKGRVGFAKAKHTAPEIITHWDANGNYVNEE